MVTIELRHRNLHIMEEMVFFVNRICLIDLFIRQEMTVSLYWGLIKTSYVQENTDLPAE